MREAKIIKIPKISDPRGNLSFFENNNHIPFEIKKAYWIHGALNEAHQVHTSISTEELIIPLSGSLDVVISDGIKEKKYRISKAFNGLYIPPLYWRSLKNFSENSLALIVTSSIKEIDI